MAPLRIAIAPVAVLAVLAAAGAAAQGRAARPDDTLEFLDDPAPRAKTPAAEGAPRAADLPFGADTVRAVVEEHRDEVTGCYEASLAQGQHREGEVRVRFTIAKNGRVSEAAVQRSTLRQPRVERCIVEAVRRWEFPRPPRPRTVIFPFQLSEERAAQKDQVVDPPSDEAPAARPAPAPGDGPRTP